MMIILFGLLGSGKNFVGEVLRDDYGMTFYDADTDLPPAMRGAIQRREIVPDTVRDQFFDIVVNRLAELKARSPFLAGAQALYKEKHRLLIHQTFPEATFILVHSSEDLIRTRLASRNNQFVDFEYARKIAPAFEQPRLPHRVLDNTGGRTEVKQQIDQILPSLAASRRQHSQVNQNTEQGATNV